MHHEQPIGENPWQRLRDGVDDYWRQWWAFDTYGRPAQWWQAGGADFTPL